MSVAKGGKVVRRAASGYISTLFSGENLEQFIYTGFQPDNAMVSIVCVQDTTVAGPIYTEENTKGCARIKSYESDGFTILFTNLPSTLWTLAINWYASRGG